MDAKQHAAQMKAYLDSLCEQIGSGRTIVRYRRWWRTPLAASVAIAIALGAGCGGSDEPGSGTDATLDDNALLEDDFSGKADGIHGPVARFRIQPGQEAANRVLMVNFTSELDPNVNKKVFHAEVLVDDPNSMTPPLQISGVYKFKRPADGTSDKRYLSVTVHGTDDPNFRFEYKFQDGLLHLRKIFTQEWFVMEPMDGEPECGGTQNTQCPNRMACSDVPNDHCDPTAGDTGCAGICLGALYAAPNFNCGGPEDIECSPGFYCNDILTDDCVPAEGDVDCWGICRPQHILMYGAPVPPLIPSECGGVTGIQCPEPFVCVDDTSDSCDPAAGGADCPGICEVGMTPLYAAPGPPPPPPPPPPFMCGGPDDRPCGFGMHCEDDQNDDCDPRDGDEDCWGVCQTDMISLYSAPLDYCGGPNNVPCGPGLICVDGAGDICDPTEDADCSGICVAGALYAAPTFEICNDRIDNDANGLIDCADPYCESHFFCAGHLYGVPEPESVCNDGIDNDFDGRVDCDDSDCRTFIDCLGQKYGVPLPPPEVCDDGADNDADGYTDCDDPDCRSLPNCNGARYGIPMPQ